MKKMVFVALMALASLSVQASGIRESQLFGKYELVEYEGGSYDLPSEIEFREDGTCVYTDGRGTITFLCYFGSNDTNYLHLISDKNFIGDTHLTVLNLRVYEIGVLYGDREYYLKVGPMGGDNWALMHRTEWDSGVRSVTAEKKDGGKMYGIDGTETDSPKGVYIQDGVKKTAK